MTEIDVDSPPRAAATAHMKGRIAKSKRDLERHLHSELLAGLDDAESRVVGALMLSESRRPHVRLRLLDGLSGGDNLIVRTVARSALGDGNGLVRARAADVLGSCGDASDRYRLGRSLSDPDWRVRSSAAIALAEVGGTGDCEALLATASGDGSWVVRRDACIALAELGSEDLVPSMARLLCTESRREVVAAILVALYRFGERHHLSQLEELMLARDPLIRENALHAIRPDDFTPADRWRITVTVKRLATEESHCGVRAAANELLARLFGGGEPLEGGICASSGSESRPARVHAGTSPRDEE